MSKINRSRSLWPLPGGRGNYLAAMRWILEKVRPAMPTDELLDLVIKNFKLSSRDTAYSYLRVIHDLGLLEVKPTRVDTTQNGQDYVETQDREIIIEALINRIAGTREVIQVLSQSSMAIGKLSDEMKDLGYDSWKTKAQLRYRLHWLEEVGMVKKVGSNTRPTYEIAHF